MTSPRSNLIRPQARFALVLNNVADAYGMKLKVAVRLIPRDLV